MKKYLIKTIKILATIILFVVLLIAYILVFHTYHDFSESSITMSANIDFSKNDIDGDGVTNIEDIVYNARDMKGVMYEYLQGDYNNIGKKLGFLVCIDIPNIAYKKAGIDFENLLRKDYKVNKNFYSYENGINTPVTSFFFRRTRNLYSYCKANNKLIRKYKFPKAGDLIFNKAKTHISMVTEVHDDGTYNEIENAPWTVFTVEHKNKVWIPKDIGRILNK